MLYHMSTKHISVRGINGSRIATATVRSGGAGMFGLFVMVGALSAFSLAILAALAIVALVGLVAFTAALIRRPNRPAVVAYDAHNDAAALAHRARMAAIRNGR